MKRHNSRRTRRSPQGKRWFVFTLIGAGLALAVMLAYGKFLEETREARGITYDEAQMYARADDLMGRGYKNEALRQLSVYCDAHEGDWHAWLKLAGWCKDAGRSARSAQEAAATALEAICLSPDHVVEARKALFDLYADMGDSARAADWIGQYARENPVTSDAGIVLAPDHSSSIVHARPGAARLTYHTSGVAYENATLSVTGKNLFSGSYSTDSCLDAPKKGFRTTDWFDLSADGATLTISGGFNRAIWQFELADGSKTTVGDEKTRYRRTDTKEVTNRIVTTAAIPESAVVARVAFADENDAESDTLDERLQIEYGTFPTDYMPYSHTVINLPVDAGYDRIDYSDGAWKGSMGDKETVLNLPALSLEKGSTLTYQFNLSVERMGQARIDRDLRGYAEIFVQPEAVKPDGIYGVRWKESDPSILLERTDDAVGLSFDYMTDSTDASPQNDFDSIAPWSGMRLCAIDRNGTIRYEGDAGFARDGSAGNVFVEIPKHYVMRSVVDGVEQISISAVPREGFQLDPSFVAPGGEVDYVYIAAYMSSVDGETISSASGRIPLINLSLNQLRERIPANGAGYAEMDLTLLMTVQRLWLVETAVRNTQAVFDGVCDLNYVTNPKNADEPYSLYAKESAPGSQSILVMQSYVSKRFCVGDAVGISAYSEYDNKNSRRIIAIDREGEQYLRIRFSGDPIDIVQNETVISHIAMANGATDGITYPTGGCSGTLGAAAFKYRNIENLWGNDSVALDGVRVTGDRITVTYPDGRTQQISYPLARQSSTLAAGTKLNLAKMCVRTMGYDVSNPLVMMPAEAGAGASSYYGDLLITVPEPTDAKERIVVYGGTWDIDMLCGLFSYRTYWEPNGHSRDYSSRMMVRRMG